MKNLHAFTYDDRTAIDEYLTAQRARQAENQRICDAAEQLGNNLGVAVCRNSKQSSPGRIVGLMAAPHTCPPPGWVRRQDNILVPAERPDGEQARAWLAHNQFSDAANTVAVLARHGLPPSADRWDGSLLIGMVTPEVFVHEGRLWAGYNGARPDDCRWSPCVLSRYFAAHEKMTKDLVTDLLRRRGVL